MTRTYLIELANKIIRSQSKSFTDPTYYGVMYVSNFEKKEIVVLTDIDCIPVAVIYNKTIYCITPVGYKGAAAIRCLYEMYKCNTKVLLYPNPRNTLFKDEQGEFRSYKLANNSCRIDYCDCIPMPYPKI